MKFAMVDGMCPSAELLALYVQGDLDDDVSCQIDQHLDACFSCDEAAITLERERQGHWQSPEDATQQCLALDPAQTEALRKALLVPAPNDLNREASILARRQAPQPVAIQELGGFLLLETLGEGGFATVYLAQHRSMQRRVALKVSAARSDEASVLSGLDHPNIVRVFNEEFVAERGLYLLSMQYASGGSLRQVIDRVRNTPPAKRRGDILVSSVTDRMAIHCEERSDTAAFFATELNDWSTVVCWLGARMADALDYAHRRGVLHRDLKPANVLLSANCWPMLADFNLSFGADIAGARADDYFGGSVPYMSPEQLEVFTGKRAASQLTPASDIYSLGVLLWELSTGELPFKQTYKASDVQGLAEMIRERRQGSPTPPDHLPRGMQLVLREALHPDLVHRISNAGLIAWHLQLAAVRNVHDLLLPREVGWEMAAARWPVATLLLCAWMPNALLSVMNSIFNHTLIHSDRLPQLHLSHAFLNVTVLPAAAVALTVLARPIVRALHYIPKSELLGIDGDKARKRCLAMGTLTALVILACWVASGVAYPILIMRMGGRSEHLLTFFVSQVLHGVIASSIGFFAVTYLAIRCFLPRLIPGPLPELVGSLVKLHDQTNWHSAILGLMPPCSLIAVAVIQLHNETILLMLGLFGVLGYVVSLVLSRRIHVTLQLLSFATTPVSMLLFGQNQAALGSRSTADKAMTITA